MKICAYVFKTHAKKAYKNESYNTRLFAGMEIVIDILKRAGYEVEFSGAATVHKYDVVLVSITSDCDWWSFVEERAGWRKGSYKVIAGGQGVLNVRPFLQWVDYFVLGRAEGVIDKLARSLDGKSVDSIGSVVESKTFSADKNYKINQVEQIYKHEINLQSGAKYREDIIGCNHRCLFCGYTWHRKSVLEGDFKYSGLWNGGEDRERAMIDLDDGAEINFTKLRTTAIDGMSERLRFKVNKKITRDMLVNFIQRLHTEGKPHQVKLYNIIGYPTETEEDWTEFLEDLKKADAISPVKEKQTSILLHSTPFRAMPATPMACEPMSYKNYRGRVAKALGAGLKGNIIYQGKALWAVESMATESLPTVAQSAIIWRGTEKDADNVLKLSQNKKFKTANAKLRQATLEKYFDMDKLFGRYESDELPTKYLKTYSKVEKCWGGGRDGGR